MWQLKPCILAYQNIILLVSTISIVLGIIVWANCRSPNYRSNQLRILIDFTPDNKQLKPLNIISNYYQLFKLNCTDRMSYSHFRDSNSNESRRTISFD